MPNNPLNFEKIGEKNENATHVTKVLTKLPSFSMN